MRVLFHQHLFDDSPKEYNVSGKTFGEIIQKIGIKGRVIIYDWGDRLEYPACHDLEPKSQAIRIIRIPEDKKTWMQVGGVVGIVAGAALSMFGAPLLGAALVTAGTSMLSASFIKKPNQTIANKDLPEYVDGYSLYEGNNPSAIGRVPPVVIGKHKILPPVVGTAISSIKLTPPVFSGFSSTQHVKFMYCLGYITEDTLVTDIKLGGSLFCSNKEGIRNGQLVIDGNFSGTAELKQDGTLPEMYQQSIKETQINSEIKVMSQDYAKTFFVTQPNTVSINICIYANGLYKQNEDGSLGATSVDFTVYYRKSGVINWNVLGNGNVTGNRNQLWRKQWSFNIPEEEISNNESGIWEILVCRASENTDNKSVNRIVLGWIQSVTTEPPVSGKIVGKLTYLCCEFQASENNIKAVQSLTCVVQNAIPIWNGSNWNNSDFTSNPAAWYRWVLKSPCLSKQAPDSRIADLETLYDWCEQENRTVNAVISSPVQIRDLLDDILSTAQSNFTLKNGLYSYSHDKSRINPVALITPKNSSEFSITKNFTEAVDAIDVTFNDEASDWEEVTETILPYGATEYSNASKIRLWGTTNYEQAVKIARYLLACNVQRSESYKLKIGIEHYSIPRGERVIIQHDVLSVGVCSGRILDVDDVSLPALLTIDETVKTQYRDSVNYIKSVPDDIKLELNNGTLTLKAGSKLYIPNGSGVFDVYTVASDISRTFSVQNVTVLIFFNTNNLLMPANAVTDCTSGTTPPSGSGMFYDTNANTIRSYTSGTPSTNKISFPFAQLSFDSDGNCTIDQVFNGIGYIGLTVFTTPGLTVVIPEELNADGSKKIVEYTSTIVRTKTVSYNHTIVTLGRTYMDSYRNFTYNEEENKNYFNDGTWSWKEAVIANITVESNRITNMELRFKEADSFGVKVFLQDGTIRTISVLPNEDSSNKLQVSQNDAFGINKGDLYAYGPTDMEVLDCVVQDKIINEDGSCELVLIPYDESIYTATDRPVPAYNPKIYGKGLAWDLSKEEDPDELYVNYIQTPHQGNVYYDFAVYTHDNSGNEFVNRGTLRELSSVSKSLNVFNYSEGIDPNRGLNVCWATPNSNLTSPVSFFVDNAFWKSTSITFMSKGFTLSSTKKVFMSYNDVESLNTFIVYCQNNKMYIETQGTVIDISSVDWVNPHHIIITRNWDTFEINVYQDMELKVNASFRSAGAVISTEDNKILTTEDNTNIITNEGVGVLRSALNRNILFYVFGDSTGIGLKQCTIGDLHIYDWELTGDYIENIYRNGILLLSVDKLSRYLGEFMGIPPFVRLGDSFKWINTTTDTFQQGKIYWLTPSGWALLNGNAEAATQGS